MLFSGFGLGHSVAGHQAHDLGQDRGAVQLVISIESVSVERIGSGWGFVLGSGQLESVSVESTT